MKKTAVVICPGRGTYNKDELGYLGRNFNDPSLLREFDRLRELAGQETLRALDGAERFLASRHTRGDNASALIYAATLGDFLSIERDEIEILAVTGNSMGWYSALACGGSLTPQHGFSVCNTMGILMQQALIGGQLVHPIVGEDWRPDPERRARLMSIVADIAARADHNLAISIHLGGMVALAGNEAGLAAFETTIEPEQGRFPLRLSNHAAFHTVLQAPVAALGRQKIPPDWFAQPQLPLIDGRGKIWWPQACDLNALWDYTLNAQVVETYDFAQAVTAAAREFSPDLFIITGPGTTLGGAVAQSLIAAGWMGMSDRSDFRRAQEQAPFLISMGMADQRSLVT